jgi:hypothetical protein
MSKHYPFAPTRVMVLMLVSVRIIFVVDTDIVVVLIFVIVVVVIVTLANALDFSTRMYSISFDSFVVFFFVIVVIAERRLSQRFLIREREKKLWNENKCCVQERKKSIDYKKPCHNNGVMDSTKMWQMVVVTTEINEVTNGTIARDK